MSENILEIKNLTKYYGNVLGVEDLSLELKRGEIFGFIGPNGAGKSTTIRSIMNLINKSSGQVFFNGKEFLKDNLEIKKEIGYLPSEVTLYDDFTVKSMLDFHESFYDNENIHTRRIELVNALQLDVNKKVEDLSLGNSKKLGIVLALMHQPKLLILDEPTSGLDPLMQNIFFNLLIEEKKRGATIFYSTHILSEVSKICDRVAIIRKGRLINVENVENLSNKNLTFVTIKSPQADEIIADLDVKVKSREKNMVKFSNNISDNELIKKLAKYDIEKILIEEATLDDLFLHYYIEEE